MKTLIDVNDIEDDFELTKVIGKLKIDVTIRTEFVQRMAKHEYYTIFCEVEEEENISEKYITKIDLTNIDKRYREKVWKIVKKEILENSVFKISSKCQILWR